MLKKIVLFVFILLGTQTSYLLWAQKSTNASSTIVKLKGKATREIPADELHLSIDLSVAGEDYNKVLDELSIKMEQIQILLQVERDDNPSLIRKIKNIQFSIDKHRVYNATGMQEKGFLGKATLELTLDNQLLSIATLMGKITQNDIQPSFSFIYALSDETKIKDELLQQAIEDARARAEVVAKTLTQHVVLKVKRALLVQYEMPNYGAMMRGLSYDSMEKTSTDNMPTNRMAPIPMEDRFLNYLKMIDNTLSREVEVLVDWEIAK